jgi:hypothetical protein
MLTVWNCIFSSQLLTSLIDDHNENFCPSEFMDLYVCPCVFIYNDAEAVALLKFKPLFFLDN